MSMRSRVSRSRRDFLVKTASAGLTLGILLPGCSREEQAPSHRPVYGAIDHADRLLVGFGYFFNPEAFNNHFECQQVFRAGCLLPKLPGDGMLPEQEDLRFRAGLDDLII